MLSCSVKCILSCPISDHLCDVGDTHGGQIDHLRVTRAKASVIIAASANLVSIWEFVWGKKNLSIKWDINVGDKNHAFCTRFTLRKLRLIK